MRYAGIDIGSRTIELVVLKDRELVEKRQTDTGFDPMAAAKKLIDGVVYDRILAADATHLKKYGLGNAIAQSMHHTILPLSRREDKVTQVLWGKAAFAHQYGHPTTGMWLPEMAVDFETLLDYILEKL